MYIMSDNRSLSPNNFSLCIFVHEKHNGHNFKKIKIRATMVLIPKESSPQQLKAHHFYFQHETMFEKIFKPSNKI